MDRLRRGARIVGLNAARFDAAKHLSLPLVGDAREGLTELDDGARRLAAPTGRGRRAPRREARRASSRSCARRTRADGAGLPTYAQVIGAVNRLAGPDDFVSPPPAGCPAR